MNKNKYYVISPIIILFVIILSSFIFASVTKNAATEDLQASSGTNIIYAKIKGSNSGDVSGDVVASGHEGEILVLGYSHAISSNYDPSTGLLSGKATQYPVKMTTELGKASPILLKILTTGETVTSAVFNFYKYNPSGVLINYYRITLEKGRITEYSSFGNSNGNFETYSFIYQKITWYNLEAGIQYQLDLSTK